MISFARADGTLECRVFAHPFDRNKYFLLTYVAGCDWQAELLLRHIREQLANHLTALVERAYQAGWHDRGVPKHRRSGPPPARLAP